MYLYQNDKIGISNMSPTRWHFSFRTKVWRFFMEPLNPFWVTGFVDGEGCFSIQFVKNKKYKLGISVRISFSIGQSNRSKEMMERIALFFCQRSKNIRSDKSLLKYETKNLNHILQTIIPHFQKYPLQSNKKNDFLAFSKVCVLLQQKSHLTNRGLKQILDIEYQMNLNLEKKTRRGNTKTFSLNILTEHCKM